MNTRGDSGIAIVTALLILLAVFGLGVGAVFLAQMNLGMAVNARSNAIAQANAESGVEATIIALERAFFTTGSFPSSVSTSVTGVRYTAAYSASFSTSGNIASIEVVGFGPSNAEHLSSAAIAMVPGEPGVPPEWKYGLASEATCVTTGTSQFLNAGIHCNNGFNLGNDTYGVCDERAADGTCTSFTEIPVADAPVSASLGATECSPNDLCEGGVPKTMVEPISITPDYVVKRDEVIALSSSSGGTYSNVFNIQCDVVLSTATASTVLAAAQGETVCIESTATLTLPVDSVLDGVNVITMGSVVFGAGTIIEDSTIVSTLGRVEAASNGNANTAIVSSEIFSELGVRLNGQQSTISGITTIASAGSVTLNGGAPATTADDGTLGIGLVVIAEGDVTVNGNSDWFVGVLTSGTFTQNGTSTLYGNVAGKGTLRFNGGVDIDSGLPILNRRGDRPGEPSAEVISRR